jgi:glycosyltransferase involved in cell wall biosynthesis
MRLLFAHDHRFRRGAVGELYTAGSFPASVWDRFLDQFEQVHIVARDGGLSPEGACLARADRAGVSFEFLPSLASVRQLVFRSRNLHEQMRTAVLSSDAVVARLPSEIGLLAISHARIAGKPYAIEVVGCAWDGFWNNGTLLSRLYATVAFLRARREIWRAPLALYVTSSWLQKRYPTQGEWQSASNVQLEPIDAAAMARRETRLAALAAGKTPVLGTIASLQVKWKGVQTALAALAQLRSVGVELTYRILGSGPIEPWQALVERLRVADLVRFDGTRSAGEGVCSWLDSIDIHLQPSFQEGLPRGTIEAMNRGVACVGSTCGGIPELLPKERLHRPGDVAGLAEIIRRLSANPSAIAAASRIDRETAQQFNPERLAERRREFYARLRTKAESNRGRVETSY